ncbi:MAG: T9SS type A sorting domain-containing protein [Candidatus Zixiibacteriota bacterium]|nr:MAG: T9SS type A sorting domain-containing protein [candidate division Zixibacteria bacterium]
MRGNKDMRAKTLLIRMLIIVAVAAVPLLAQGPTPTSQWTDFVGLQCTINGAPIPVGTEITAFDPDGVLCGLFVTTDIGVYGTLHVYGDDMYTEAVDEGCIGSDHITFKMNEKVATELGPDSDMWVGIGTTKTMNLAITQVFDVAAAAPTDGADSAGVIVSYNVIVTNNGDGSDLIALTVTSKSGWVVTGNDASGQSYKKDEQRTLPVTVAIPAGTPLGYQDTLTVVAASRFDPAATATKKIVTTVDKKTGVDDGNFNVPGIFTLNQNFPNPFNPETVISFSLDKPGDVTLAVYDILGRTVTTLYQGYLATGQHQFRWNGSDGNGQGVASGVYFYRLSSDQISLTRKMALMK